MPHVVPSDVVRLIDRFFAFKPFVRAYDRNSHVDAVDRAKLAAVLSSAEKVPSHLLTIAGQDYIDYLMALAVIEDHMRQWTAGGRTPLNGDEHTHPLALIRSALAKCPDQAPSLSTTELPFVADPLLRDSIRRDISAANQDLVNGEWKGATVLAGSAAEALLLYAIKEAEAKSVGAIVAACAAIGKKLNPDPDCWDLAAYIDVALHLKAISAETAAQTRLAKDFRNLIHPGRAARLAQVCDRATALSALAAVEHIARDLS